MEFNTHHHHHHPRLSFHSNGREEWVLEWLLAVSLHDRHINQYGLNLLDMDVLLALTWLVLCI